MTREQASSSGAIWSASTLSGDPHQSADKAHRVKAMFAAIAGSYDRNNRVHSLGRDQAWRRRAAHLASIGPGDRVLDVACGTGDLTEALAGEGPAEVIGVDFTEPMLALARTKSGARRRAAGAPVPSYRLADAMELPFDAASFDVVTIAFGIRNVADPVRALLEFRRVLRRGGRLVVLEFGRPRGRLARFGSDLYCRRIMPVTASWIAHDRTGAYRYLPRSVATFPDGDAFGALLSSAGFEACQTHPMTFGIAVAYRGVAG